MKGPEQGRKLRLLACFLQRAELRSIGGALTAKLAAGWDAFAPGGAHTVARQLSSLGLLPQTGGQTRDLLSVPREKEQKPARVYFLN